MWLATCAAAWPLTPRRTERDEGRSRQDAALCRARNNPAYRRLTASLRHPAPASQPAPPDALAAPVTTEEQIFMTALGRRMAELRKACGLTQTQMAQALEVSQQAVQSWEAGRRRIQISVLPAVARLLSVSLEVLLGEETENTPRKRGPASRLEQQIEVISQLPKARQKMVSEMLDAVIAQAQQQETGS